MKQEAGQPKLAYDKPKVEVLGTFAGLTLGSKTSGVADMHSGFAHTSGPGS
jgi:hypothetical protein